MNDDFRALCAELAAWLHAYALRAPLDIGSKDEAEHDLACSLNQLLARARAALSAPEQGPTDEDLIELFNWNDWNYISPETFIEIARTVLEGWGRPAVETDQWPSEAELKTFACQWWHSFGFVKDKATYDWVIDNVALEHFADFSLDVLARWGRPAVKPVPVSERLPGPEDCDDQGRCWFGTPGSHVMDAYWVYRKAEHRQSWDTYWTPHWALPVPQEEADD